MNKEDSALLSFLHGFVPGLVLDIGANQGESIVRFKALWPDTQIVSFEPRLDAYLQLVIAGKDYEGVKCCNFGIGSFSGIIEINEVLDKTGFGGRSTILDLKILPPGHTTEKKAVAIFKLDDLRVNLPDFTTLFIKVDVEGYAKHVIDGGREVFRRAHACLIEVNLNNKYKSDQTTTEEVRDKMITLGFEFSGLTRRVNSGGQLWQDELWMKAIKK